MSRYPSPARRRVALATLVTLAVFGSPLATTMALAQETIGVFFDQAGTLDRISTTGAYQAVPIYLVLAQNSVYPISGWECRLDLRSEAVLPPISWTYAGRGLNIFEPPLFQVGTIDPLLGTGPTLLASGILLVPSTGTEIEIRVLPADHPSLRDALFNPVQVPVYAPTGDPGALMALSPVSGCPSSPVAIVNDDGVAAAVALTVEPPTLDFGTLPPDGQEIRQATLRNAGDAAVVWSLATGPLDYRVSVAGGTWGGGTSGRLLAGESTAVSVMFAPGEAGPQAAALTFEVCGQATASLACTGAGTGPGGICVPIPTALEFGEVVVGAMALATFTLWNRGTADLPLAPSSPCPDFHVVDSGPFTLAPGESRAIRVVFEPLAGGPLACLIDLGEAACGEVACTGSGRAPLSACALVPESLDFGRIELSSPGVLTQSVRNEGESGFYLSIPGECGPFQVTAGAGNYFLIPGAEHNLTIRYAPLEEGTHACTLDLGAAACTPSQLRGEAYALPAVCELTPASLDFGEAPVGLQGRQTLRIRNAGLGILAGEVPPSCGPFVIASGRGPFALRAGEFRDLEISLTPTQEGPLACSLDLGCSFCAPVALTATGVPRQPICELVPAALDFGQVGVGTYAEGSLTIRNIGNETLTGTVPSACGAAFSTTMGGGPFSLAPGSSRTVRVLFSPASAQAYACSFDIEGLCAPLPLAGTGAPAGTFCDTSPDTLDFGDVPVGQSAYRSLTVINTGTVNMTVSAGAVCGPFRPVSSGSLLTPGQSCQVAYVFTPLATGEFTCLVNLNVLCRKVLLKGQARHDPSCCLQPVSLDFGQVMLGSAAERSLTITNCGGGILEGVVPETCGAFATVEGAGALSLPSGATHTVRFRFAPEAIQPYVCELSIGGVCGPIPLTGVGIAPGPICSLSPGALAFGNVELGAHRDLSFTLANSGLATLAGGIPAACGPDFQVLEGTGPYALEPGEGTTVLVRFAPTSEGSKACALTLGAEACQDVLLSGQSRQVLPDADRIGVFWDIGAAITCRDAPTGMVTGYLTVLNPSASGVAGWECRIDWQPQGFFVPLSWEALGDGPFVLGTPPDFQVGLHTPLLSAAVVPVLRLNLFVTTPEAVWFKVGPLQMGSSVPGVPCYADAADPGHLVPLTATSGSYSLPVAQLNGCSALVGTLGGAPVARLAPDGRGIAISWRLGPAALAAGDAYHVLRRVDGAQETRLTAAPLPLQGGEVEYLDVAADVAAGARLVYAFALQREGIETGRSPAVEIDYRPQLPERPILHACRPNPFNPRTTVAFELPRSGRARLEVFDLTGRRCCVLLDGDLAAGPHERVWEGLDAAGRRAPSGTYYARLTAGGEAVLRKMTLLK